MQDAPFQPGDAQFDDSPSLDVASTVQPLEQMYVSAERSQLSTSPDYALRNYVAGMRAGLVEYDSENVLLERLLIQAIEVAERPVAVVCANLRQIEKLLPAIRQQFGKVELQAAGLWLGKGRGISIGSWPALKIVAREKLIRTCLLLEPTGLLNPNRRASIPEAARIIGLQPLSQRMVRSERLELSQILTDPWLTIPLHGRVLRPVHVQQIPLSVSPKGEHQDPFEAKQRAIWRCPIRNRLVGGVAKRLAMRQGAEAKLRRSFQLETDRLIVAVESLEHAAVLQVHHLKDWPIICIPGADTTGLSRKAQFSPIPREPWSLKRPAIATFTALPRIEYIDTIIRADGGVGSLPVAVETLACTLDDSQPLLIFDMTDLLHPLLSVHGAKRVRAYRKSRWSVSTPAGRKNRRKGRAA